MIASVAALEGGKISRKSALPRTASQRLDACATGRLRASVR